MIFSLATVRVDGSPTPVLVHDGRHYRITDLAPEVLAPDAQAGLMTVLRHWTDAEPVLLDAVRSIKDGSRTVDHIAAPARLEDWLTPLQYPNKVICTGANYYDHVFHDGGHASFSKEDNIPVFFLKPPTTTLVGQ